jgi:hypothetical protein
VVVCGETTAKVEAATLPWPVRVRALKFDAFQVKLISRPATTVPVLAEKKKITGRLEPKIKWTGFEGVAANESRGQTPSRHTHAKA